jgi:hypothetical protein
MEINDREFRLIIPKYDNDLHKIKAEEVKEIAKEMSEQFGGVTVYPSVLGCWKDTETGKLQCEENIVITATRDSENTKNYEEQLKRDREKMEKIAKKYGKRFGQKSVMWGRSITEVKFEKGKFRKSVPEHIRGIDFFEKLI